MALALHCTLGHSGAWRGLGTALAHEVTLTAIDLPSHGQSTDWDGKMDIQAACVAAARPFLTAPVDLIGHSFGATVALRLAVETPALVRSLTLIEPVFFAAAALDAPQVLATHQAEEALCAAALVDQDMALAARLFNRTWGDGTPWHDYPEKTRVYMTDRMHLIPAQAPSIIEDTHGLLAPGRLARVTAPTLLVEGAQSPPVIAAIHAALAARLPNARRQVIAGAGHMAPITHPQAVAAAIMTLP